MINDAEETILSCLQWGLIGLLVVTLMLGVVGAAVKFIDLPASPREQRLNQIELRLDRLEERLDRLEAR